ncbi:MAG: bifunctional diaminohydroxyphosphoribosylaminopyrimidine deaminase/5-amino-6-(5-phosphoribosylamino)uracil reductase RibD [Zetaproteobacteria bacterium]|nr:MAG: bifunctional diaminohydroxyphosphoribosylaminopyrimidine deaminase/5-amino-6-(5-phosphoribosylamino)uracil reductase RibD [Zetaproteobacteria bacterium]
MMVISEHERFMRQALELARKGIGRTHPNPRVGALVVRDGQIVGTGWHERAGQAHAEVVALREAGEAARHATVYVTLEPCAAHGRTPPCTDALIAAGVSRVVYASRDPNPSMAGGADRLRSKGIEVVEGVLADEADELNRPFFHFIRTGLPWIRAKAAVSLDGKMATHTGHSRWITGVQARRHVHRIRAMSDAIVVGAGTLAIDNPELTVRDAPLCGDPPLRVVLADRVPPFSADYRILSADAPSRMYVLQPQDGVTDWQRAGVEIVNVTDLEQALRHLADDGFLDVLVEGGGRLHASLFKRRLSCELLLYQAPVLIGGIDAPGLWHGPGVSRMEQAPRLDRVERIELGPDQLIRGHIVYPEE